MRKARAMKLSYGKRVTHDQFGDGVVVTPRTNSGETTVRFGIHGTLRKCCPTTLKPRTRKRAA